MEHGLYSEAQVEASCMNIFGEDFVFRSPNIISETGKKTEMTDVLVILGKYLITIQSKSISLNTRELDDVKFGRVVKRYEDAKRQINRTLNAFQRKVSVELKTRFGLNLNLPWNNIEEIIGIITINIDDPEYYNTDKRFQFPLKVETHKNITLHTFILNDFNVMVGELTTGGDFIRYLNTRKSLSKIILENFTNELDLVAMFAVRYDVIQDVIAGEIDRLVINPGIWEYYIQKFKDEIIKKNNKKFQVTIFDVIIHELRKSIEYSVDMYGYNIDEMTEFYFKILGLFGLLSRVECYSISEIFREKLELSKTSDVKYFMYPSENTIFLFIISNLEDREKRRNQLYFFTGNASHHIKNNERFRNIDHILSIITDGKKLESRSLDINYGTIDDATEMIDKNDYVELFKMNDLGEVNEWDM